MCVIPPISTYPNPYSRPTPIPPSVIACAVADPTSVRVSRQTSNRNHNLTYGEVLPESIEEKVIPALGRLSEDDVFYDLGSGSGKIVLQVALQTGVGKSCGVEFARTRHSVAEEMHRRLGLVRGEEVQRRAELVGWADGVGESGRMLAEQLREAQARVRVVRGDFIREDLDDATVVFINNAVFEADLMAALLAKLAHLPRLRRVVCLRKLCYRCGSRCERRREPCTAFQRPPKEDSIMVRPHGQMKGGKGGEECGRSLFRIS